jgi:hypothetical protein
MSEPTNIDELVKIDYPILVIERNKRKCVCFPKGREHEILGHADSCKRQAIDYDDFKQLAIRDIKNCKEVVHMFANCTMVYCGKTKEHGRCDGCKRLMRFCNLKEKDLK